jgi:hypothetical protein
MKLSTLMTLACIFSFLFVSGCINEDKTSDTDEETSYSYNQTEDSTFGQYYKLETSNVKPQAAQYNLPLDISDISNYDEFTSVVQLDEEEKNKLQENGFVVIANPFKQNEEIITDIYDHLEENDVPIFVTSDSLLHIYHIQFDESLRQIEENTFYDTLWELDQTLLNESLKTYETSDGDIKEAAYRNAAYFSVALSLLEPQECQISPVIENDQWSFLNEETNFSSDAATNYNFEIPEIVQNDVESELALIYSHENMTISPIFNYQEDYTQYVPRGHYTRTEKLKNYFRTFMWHGRMSMLLKGDIIEAEDPEHEAEIQTLQASLIASSLENDSNLMDKWDNIYTVTAFYVGFSDDLGPYEYTEAMNEVMGENNNIENLDTEALKAELASYRSPKIYGGTGAIGIDSADPEELDNSLEDTKGFRFMGQRYVPDSYMFQNLIYPAVADRSLPKGLDIMTILGSERAYEHLQSQGETNYPHYNEQISKLEEEFDLKNESEWTMNLYWSWLYALQPLLKDYGDGYPTFMQTEAWQDKQLSTSLASWTELRHDTILYAKQFTGFFAGLWLDMEEKEPVVGYVEPVPEFYNRLLALNRMTSAGLDDMGVLDNASRDRMNSIDSKLETLINISEKELQNEELSKEEYDFIESFGEEIEDTISGVNEKAQKTTIVADVGTDPNTGSVLEEGVGYVDMIVVAYKLPDGRILIGAGPVMTYYEFEQPMSERLTDEAWREMLQQSAPEKPEWTESFSV